MEKIKSLFKKAFDTVKKNIKEFPVTMIIIAACTLFLCIMVCFNSYYFIDDDLSLRTVYASALFAIGSFFTEVTKKDDKKRKMIMYILAFLVAIGFGVLTFSEDDVIVANSLKCAGSYAISLEMASIYLLHKKSKLSFDKYIREVIINFIKIGITSFVLSIGVTIIYFTLYELFDLDYDVTENIVLIGFLLVTGMYTTTRSFYAFNVEKTTDSKFFKGLLEYALGGIILIITAIIYAYLLKTFFAHEELQNVIYRNTAVLFLVGVFTWTTINSYNENKVYNKLFKYLPYVFAPFIILQIYSLGVRIIDNGLTPVRYLGIMYIIIEIIYLVLYKFKREKLPNILFAIAGVVCISLIVPVINMDKLSEINQTARVKTFFKVENPEDLSYEQKEKIKGAYYYLVDLDNGYSIIEDLFTYEQREIIRNFNSNTYYNDDYKDKEIEETKYIYFRNYDDSFDIEGYSKMYKVRLTLTRYYANSGDDISYFDVDFDDDYVINLKPVVDSLIDMGSEAETVDYLDIDENNKLYFNYADIEYIDKDNLRSCEIEGILFTK